jgi:hypothetical protein
MTEACCNAFRPDAPVPQHFSAVLAGQRWSSVDGRRPSTEPRRGRGLYDTVNLDEGAARQVTASVAR